MTRAGRAPARRKLVWVRNDFAPAAAASAFSSDLLAGFRVAGASTLGCTVRRVLIDGVLTVATGTPTAQWSAGVGVLVDNLAQATPPAAAASEDDWLWNALYSSWQGPALGGDKIFVHVDTRAMRKVEELNQTLWMSVNNMVGGPTTTDVYLRTSVLLALP